MGVFPQPTFREDPLVTKEDLLYETRRYQDKSTGSKIQLVVFAALTFILVSNNVAYRFTNELWAFFMSAKNEVLGENGLPTIKGVALHAFIFAVILAALS